MRPVQSTISATGVLQAIAEDILCTIVLTRHSPAISCISFPLLALKVPRRALGNNAFCYTGGCLAELPSLDEP